MDWLNWRIKDLQSESLNKGMNYVQYSTKWMSDRMQNPNNYFKPVKINNIISGKFYFLFYDLEGKSKKMEKYSPILIVDNIKINNKNILLGLSFNWIPIKIRLIFFNSLFNSFEDVINKNVEKKSVEAELPIQIDLNMMITLLKSINFDYCIRKFEMDKINKVYGISILDIDKFLCSNSAIFTGVDEKKMAEIWLSKLKKGEDKIKSLEEELKKIKQTTDDNLDKIKNKEKSIKELDEINKKLNKL